MEAMQGAVLRVKLRHLESWTEARRAHATLYNELLADSWVQPPEEMPYARHVYHVYPVRTPQRDALQRILHGQNIQTGIHYPLPVHLQPAYADLGYGPGDFVCSEQAACEELSLPIYPELPEPVLRTIAACINAGNILEVSL